MWHIVTRNLILTYHILPFLLPHLFMCFKGEDGKQSARKHLVVLGGDPQTTRPIAKRKEKKESLIANKKPKHLFNHCEYAIYK